MKRITVRTSSLDYPVMVGMDAMNSLNSLVNRQASRSRVFIFFDAGFYALYGRALIRSIKLPADRSAEFVVPSGEKSKSSPVLAGIYDFLLSEKISRDDFIVACGGGVTTDLVGYAAATVLRGVRWGVVPTTLLAMVDAAIGGKTGLDHPGGKNLIGAFWQPTFVCCDTRYLMTLPERQLIAGLGEVLKTAGLVGNRPVRACADYLVRDDLYDLPALTELVCMSAEYKARVVSSDERDTGKRIVLNLGHTFAHGIETTVGYGRILHGEAVIIGLDAALVLGERLGYRTKNLEEYRALVFALMQRLPRRRINAAEVWKAMALDKKRSAGNHRFVVLKRLGQPVVRHGVAPTLARSALAEALERYHDRKGQNV